MHQALAVLAVRAASGFSFLSAVILVAGLAPPAALAHESGASSLHLRVAEARVEGEWELTASDARALLGAPLEREPDALSPAEEQALAALFALRIRIEADGQPCPLAVVEGPILRDGAPPSERLTLSARCPAAMESLRIAYPLLFDLDPKHRGYFSLRDAEHTQAGVFHAEQQEITLAVRHPDPLRTLAEYGREGAFHVWGGLDHLLFLIALLLPAVLGGAGRRDPEQEPGARAVALDVVRIVTAFTLAHSLTLALAVLGVVRLPSGPVEVAIALSVFAAAWNNVRPWLPVSTAWMALVFGLVHGLGFAGALVRLGLPLDARGLALLGFNLGVEAGQLLIVAVWLPIAWGARDTRAYRRWLVPGASLAIAWLAALWSLERAFDLSLLPFPF
jgi:hypothetical protein